ncbi:Tim44-like domain-containing protein [Pendulispora brunnea]|uniref:Tim44-like domain-containing protein n=1 Tax=Pendulispora brunnea TaxID=2905690 RepID=A0ABZ2K733_9BACT
MTPRARRILLISGIAFGVLLCVAAVAFARPGGGQSYSGGSRSRSSGGGGGSSSGGGDGGFLIELLVWLVFRHPGIGIPVVLIVAAIFVGRSMLGSKVQEWSTAATPQSVTRVQRVETPPPQAARAVPRSALDALRAIDPEFSVVLFEDFVYLLYAEIQRARAGAGRLASITAFLSPQLAQNLQAGASGASALADVRGIVIGAMRLTGFSGTSNIHAATVSVELEFEVNYVEVNQQGGEQRFYVTDRMGLSRARTAQSRPPARARTLDCPNCGAPLENMRGTQCAFCQQDVGGGRFDWNVGYLSTMTKERRGPLLTGDVQETGTNEPTLVDPQAVPRIHAFEQRDPAFNWDAFTNRAAHIFGALQGAWSGREPARIRPYVSDNLFQSMVYWIDLYVQARCRNMNDNARILRIDLANVLSDKVYDAITVRIFATGADYTISDDGKVLSGSRSRERTYSEYWTFIRGSQRQGPARTDAACPNCGAPLDISMVGNCQFCRAKVTAGEFDWVLSRIEQDESYTG